MQAETKKKEYMNVGTIGHVDHGKTTLTSAITYVLQKDGFIKTAYTYEQIDKAPEERQRGVTINATIIKYETEKRVYAHVDCPGHEEYVKNMIVGTSQMDGAILVVSLKDGVMPQTKEHIILARELGIKQLIVFLSKCDEVKDEEVREFVRMDVQDLLEKNGYDSQKIPMIEGAAREALHDNVEQMNNIRKLLQTMDEYFFIPERDMNSPFLMYIDNVHSIKGQGTVVTGKIEKGTVRLGEEIEIIGFKKRIKNIVKGIEAFHSSLQSASCGDNVGISLRGVDKNELQRGQVIAAVGTIKSWGVFTAQIYALTQKDGGRRTPFGIDNKYSPQFFFKTANLTGRIILPEGMKMINPGDSAVVTIELLSDVAMTERSEFSVREGNKTIAVGLVKELISLTPNSAKEKDKIQK